MFFGTCWAPWVVFEVALIVSLGAGLCHCQTVCVRLALDHRPVPVRSSPHIKRTRSFRPYFAASAQRVLPQASKCSLAPSKACARCSACKAPRRVQPASGCPAAPGSPAPPPASGWPALQMTRTALHRPPGRCACLGTLRLQCDHVFPQPQRTSITAWITAPHNAGKDNRKSGSTESSVAQLPEPALDPHRPTS